MSNSTDPTSSSTVRLTQTSASGHRSDDLKLRDSSQQIRFAYLAALRAGPILEPVECLEDSSLYAPLDLSYDNESPTDLNSADLSICGYKVVREINSGGQATVYEGLHEITGQRVAIKVITGGRFAGSKPKARFEQEINFLATLHHTNIVNIMDCGRSADGSWFLAMRYIEGCSLQEFWTDKLGRTLTDTRTLLTVFHMLADAVGEAHCQRIVHRDLKPANVRVDDRGNPFVLDFGLAKALLGGAADDRTLRAQELTQTGQVMGSVQWNSPEQAAGQVVGPQADVYAIGVMLYQAIVGTFPYPVDGTMRTLLDGIAQTVPPRASTLPGARPWPIPDALDRIIAKCLHKQPEDRYANGSELAADLHSLIQGAPVKARRIHRSRSRRFLLPAASAISIIFLVCWHSLALRASSGIPVTIIQLPSFENSLKMRFVRLPAATFWMGSPETEPGRDRDEVSHRITITKPYCIGITEVTRSQYERVMNPAALPKIADTDLPVTDVTWKQAVEFCNRLGALDGRRYRLPTEAEWEFACRGGTSQPFGGTTILAEMGWFEGNSSNRLHPVAQLRPNQYGIYDMHGNAAEWVEDTYEEYGDRPQSDPHRSGQLPMRVVRGGSFLLAAGDCRSGRRATWTANAGSNDIGFRVVTP